ncbi:MAG: M13 family metallopeptidase [Marinifilaceae bacterium]
MNKIITMATCLFMAGCGVNKSSEKVPAISMENFDTSIPLNDDFYQYTTGGWQRNNPLKPEYARYGAFDVLRDNNELRIKELFAGMEQAQGAQGSVSQKIADLYKLGLDSVTLNMQKGTPIQQDIDAIQALSSNEQVMEQVAKMHRGMGSPFFGAYVGSDMMNSSMNIMNIFQSGIGMGNRDYYLDDENASIRDAYKTYILEIAKLIGYNDAQAEQMFNSVMQIETELAKNSLSKEERRDPYANYHMLTKEEIKKQYPNINWELYFTTLGVPMPDSLNIAQTGFIQTVNNQIKTLPLETIKDYLTFNAVNSAASYMSDDFTEAQFNFYSKKLSGKEEQQPRWKRSLGVTNGILSEAVGEVYVEKYFPADNKARMVEMIKNLQIALGEHIDSLPWMSAETKVKAHEKLNTFSVKVGYPDKWKDYSSLNIDATQPYLENIKRAYAWMTDDDLSKVGKPVDKDEWLMSPQTVNAYYNPTTNEICFPAAILQPPFFNPDADDAVNYGAIGVVIGHEMTHGFDDKGRQFDKDGNLKNWWTAEDEKQFNERANVLVEQFNAITVVDTIKANGTFTLGENIADQGGLRVSYTALQQALKGKDTKAIDGFTPEQRFFIAYSTLWGQNVRDAEIERLTKMDPHSLGKWRVNATLRNIQEFYDAFNIEDGAMYMNPEQRVIIW